MTFNLYDNYEKSDRRFSYLLTCSSKNQILFMYGSTNWEVQQWGVLLDGMSRELLLRRKYNAIKSRVQLPRSHSNLPFVSFLIFM